MPPAVIQALVILNGSQAGTARLEASVPFLKHSLDPCSLSKLFSSIYGTNVM